MERTHKTTNFAGNKKNLIMTKRVLAYTMMALGAYSDLGKELDSLCDLVSFGVLPSIMLFVWSDELHPVLDGEFAEKGQIFKTDIQLTHSWFYGDALRISQVLINLLGNAVKYSDRGMETQLTVKETVLENGMASFTASKAFIPCFLAESI